MTLIVAPLLVNFCETRKGKNGNELRMMHSQELGSFAGRLFRLWGDTSFTRHDIYLHARLCSFWFWFSGWSWWRTQFLRLNVFQKGDIENAQRLRNYVVTDRGHQINLNMFTVFFFPPRLNVRISRFFPKQGEEKFCSEVENLNSTENGETWEQYCNWIRWLWSITKRKSF